MVEIHDAASFRTYGKRPIKALILTFFFHAPSVRDFHQLVVPLNTLIKLSSIISTSQKKKKEWKERKKIGDSPWGNRTVWSSRRTRLCGTLRLPACRVPVRGSADPTHFHQTPCTWCPIYVEAFSWTCEKTAAIANSSGTRKVVSQFRRTSF